MIVGLGIDRVQISRMEKLLKRHAERAAKRLFTAEERAVCERRARPAECFAARFAAKEAFLKAIGTGLSDGIRWCDVEVVVTETGGPRLIASGPAEARLGEIGGARTHVSFSHEGGAAVAVVLIETAG
jgi:holo-[acyl-carrier protein] synthase